MPTPHFSFKGDYATPHNTLPFDRITVDDVRRAIAEGIATENKEIDSIANNPDAPTFANTLVAFEHTGEQLEAATTYMYNQLSANTNDDLEALAQEMAPVLAAHSSDIMLNERLFRRIAAVREQAETLEGEDRMLLEKVYSAFERSGATLSAEGKERFRAITQELSQLSLTFSQNILKETNAFTLHLTHKEDVDGLPPTALEAAAQAARDRNLDGWVVTLQAPSYVPFMTYATNRALRQKLYTAYNTKCTHPNEHNNFEVVRRLVNLRQELAQLLGYPTYADYVFKRRMAENCANVYDLLDRLIDAYKDPARHDVAAVERLAKEEQGTDFKLQPWDFSFFSHKLQKRLYDIDAEMLRPYFELSAVCRGIFGLATRLYGITFRRNESIPVYHPDVEAYEVLDADGSFLAVLYADYFPRESKQGGAWMTSYKEESDGTNRPHVAITMNLTKPTAATPALLTLSEVQTFLHEFGHALHGIFANTKYQSLSGTNVYWDFVELPSQFMENFSVEREFLTTFARHYQTGEPLPDELIDRIVRSRNFNAAYACMRQVSFGLLDMAYYTLRQPLADDIRSFEHHAWQKAQLLPALPDACMTVQFSHIMSGGYSAGYYSYKWAEVLDADAFECFREEGIFNPATARRFRTELLAKGGTQRPMDLYLAFRGKKPTIDALLKRDGIKQ